MGITYFMTASDGLQVEPLNALRKAEKKPIRELRKLSRRKRSSENSKKQIVKVQKLHQQIRMQGQISTTRYQAP